jgi:hypothetical protein
VTSRHLRRAALAACPRADRPWLEALLGELAAIEGVGSRLLWLAGAGQLLLPANQGRVGV